MKVAILSLALLTCACQTTDTAANTSLQPISSGSSAEVPPFAVPADDSAVTDTLPRRIHLDRSEHAVRAWVRDRS